MFKHGVISGPYLPVFVLNTERYGVRELDLSHDSGIGLSDLRELKFKQFQKSVKIQFVDVV